MAKRVVDGLETIQIHKQHASTLFNAAMVDALHAQQGVGQAVFKQQTVGQMGQRVGKGALLQFGIGLLQLGIAFLQRLIELERSALQSGIQQGAEQRCNQQHGGGDDDDACQLRPGQRIGGEADTALHKMGGRHAGVVHAADGNAHDKGCQCLEKPEAFARQRVQHTKQGERSGRGENGDQRRCGHQCPVPGDGLGQFNGLHAQIVHGANAAAHGQRSREELRPAVVGTSRSTQCNGRRQHGRQPRKQGDQAAVAQQDRQLKGLHANKVHGPDARAHHHGANAPPQPAHAARRHAHAAGQPQRDEGGEHGNDNRYCNDHLVVARCHESGGRGGKVGKH